MYYVLARISYSKSHGFSCKSCVAVACASAVALCCTASDVKGERHTGHVLC